jgi:hypothetical protein
MDIVLRRKFRQRGNHLIPDFASNHKTIRYLRRFHLSPFSSKFIRDSNWRVMWSAANPRTASIPKSRGLPVFGTFMNDWPEPFVRVSQIKLRVLAIVPFLVFPFSRHRKTDQREIFTGTDAH